MPRNRESQFTPRLGRIRYQSGQGRGRVYLSKVQRAISRAGGSIGNSPRHAPRTNTYANRRRVIVKARIVKSISSRSKALSQHLRYISRESAMHDQDKGRLFDGQSDDADRDIFTSHAKEDRHHFRFIISPEDGAEIHDLKPFVRDLVRTMEHDLGTKLDWVGAVHHNTTYPHAHIVIRGRHENGKDLVIPRKYISHAIRERAVDLVTLELGPETALERNQKLAKQINAQSLTRIDQSLLRMADPQNQIDISETSPQYRPINKARLQALEKMHLATRTAPTRWSLTPDLKSKLMQMGEHNDMLKTLSKAAKTRKGRQLDAGFSLGHDQTACRPLIGALIETGIGGDFHDQRFVIIDTLDGNIIKSAIDAKSPEGVRPGMIVEISMQTFTPKASDQTISKIARKHNGLYAPALHQIEDPRASPGYIAAHVRRLEALRRSSGLVERLKDGTWRIPDTHLANIERDQQKRARNAPRTLEIRSALPLEKQITHHGLTWLDQRPVQDSNLKGFGAEIADAKALRQNHLLQRGLLASTRQSLTPDQTKALRQTGLKNEADKVAKRLAKTYQTAPTKGQIIGTFTGHVDLADGRYAILEGKHNFTLVRWRQIMERGRGHSMTGQITPKRISWTFGVQNGRGLSR